jgi:catalase (peroxidase I)
MSAPAGQPQVWQPTPTGANNNQFQSLFQAQPSMGGKGSATNTQFRPSQMTTVQTQQADAAKVAAEAQANMNASPLSLQYGLAGPYYGAYTGGGSS